jgi:uncharacterized damage-inducible protein DinB
MNEIERIEDQIKRAYAGPAWHGPSLKEALAGVTEIQARSKRLANSHTIWEIVNHLSAWTAVVVQRLRGEPLEQPAEGDWPEPGGVDEAAWLAALAGLESNYVSLLAEIAGMDESQLDEASADRSVSRYVHLHGTIQHYLYHAGQIALLKKMP